MIYKNGNWIESDLVNESEFNNSFTIYEVIRIFKGYPIFLEDNFVRLESSIKRSNINIDIQKMNFKEKIVMFVNKTGIIEGNIKYLISFHNLNEGIAEYSEYIYQIPHKYPTDEQYANGVATSVLYKERANPEIKYLNIEFREYANQIISERNVYELLLVNNSGEITEGSKSNIFFIKGALLYTSPDSMVLGGTARKRVLALAERMGIEVVKRVIQLSELQDFDSAFITGTSPLVLPISNIDDIKLNVNNRTLRQIMEGYFKMILT